MADDDGKLDLTTEDIDKMKLDKDRFSQEEFYSEAYNWLLQHEAYVKETIVTKVGNTGKLTVPRSWIGRRVLYAVGILDENEQL